MRRVGRVVSESQLGMLSLALMAAGFLGLGFAANIGELIFAVIAISFGSAFARPTLMATLSIAAPSSQLGAVLGFNTSVMAMCNILGPIVAGLLIGRAWYSGWAVALTLIVAATALAIHRLNAGRHWPEPRAAALSAAP